MKTTLIFLAFVFAAAFAGPNDLVSSGSSIIRGEAIERIAAPLVAMYENVTLTYNITGSALVIDHKGSLISELYQGYQNETAGILYSNTTLQQVSFVFVLPFTL
jgi:hypothetical protein